MGRTLNIEAEYSAAIADAFDRVENELHLFRVFDTLFTMSTADREVISQRKREVSEK